MKVPSASTFVDCLLGAWNIYQFVIWVLFCFPIEAEYKTFVTRGLYDYEMFKRIYKLPLIASLFACLALATLTLYLHGESRCIKIISAALSERTLVGAYTLFCSLYVQVQVHELVILGPDRFLERELALRREQIRNYQPPPKWLLRTTVGILETIMGVDVVGIDRLDPTTPGLFVANHQNYGIEIPVLANKLYQSKGIIVRGLADHFHFGIPLHSHVLRWLGAVDGTRPNVDCLMDSRQTVLVFPGGSHEVMKHSSLPRYSLLWKQRLGFASVAIKHGYPIIPVASIGIEDSVDIVFDIPLGFYRKDQSFPAPGPIWPHRLQRIYYWVGEPIPTSKYNFEWQNDGFCRELRDDTKAAVEHGIRLLQDKQAQDPNRYRFPVLTRMASSLQSFFSPRLFKNDLPDDESEQGSVTEHENRAVREKKTS